MLSRRKHLLSAWFDIASSTFFPAVDRTPAPSCCAASVAVAVKNESFAAAGTQPLTLEK